MNIDRILQRIQPRRAVTGIAAALLPFNPMAESRWTLSSSASGRRTMRV